MSIPNRRQPFNRLRNEPNFPFLVIIPETPAGSSSSIRRSRRLYYYASIDERVVALKDRIKEVERPGFDPSTLGAMRLISIYMTNKPTRPRRPTSNKKFRICKIQ